MVRKNWAHTINFEDLVKLISDCGAKELRQHLVNGARNATYTSKYTVNKYVEVLANHCKAPILNSLRNAEFFAFYCDETTDITRLL